MRTSDIVARYSGEEFVVLLPETAKAGALVKAARMRDAVGSTDMPGGRTLSLSIGVANVTAFLPRMKAWPTWITPSPGGDGFVEGMEKLLGLHQGRPGAR